MRSDKKNTISSRVCPPQLNHNLIPLILHNNSRTIDALDVVKGVADVRRELDANGIDGLGMLVAALSVGVEPDSLAAAVALAERETSVIVLDDLVAVRLQVVSADDIGATADGVNRVGKATGRVVVGDMRDSLDLEALCGVGVHAAHLLLGVPADGLALGVIGDAGLDTGVDFEPGLVASIPTEALIALATLGFADCYVRDSWTVQGGLKVVMRVVMRVMSQLRGAALAPERAAMTAVRILREHMMLKIRSEALCSRV